MGAYAYLAPQSVQEALSVLDDHLKRGERAQILSGGTDLLVQMRSVDKTPRLILDIKQLAEANRLEVTDQSIYIGASGTQCVDD